MFSIREERRNQFFFIFLRNRILSNLFRKTVGLKHFFQVNETSKTHILQMYYIDKHTTQTQLKTN